MYKRGKIKSEVDEHIVIEHDYDDSNIDYELLTNSMKYETMEDFTNPEDVTMNDDDNENSITPPIKKPRKRVIRPVNLKVLNFIEYLRSNSYKEHPIKTLIIPIKLMEVDESVRQINQLYIESILNTMLDGKWNMSLNKFKGYEKITNGQKKYYIVDGKNRLEALKRYSNTFESIVDDIEVEIFQEGTIFNKLKYGKGEDIGGVKPRKFMSVIEEVDVIRRLLIEQNIPFEEWKTITADDIKTIFRLCFPEKTGLSRSSVELFSIKSIHWNDVLNAAENFRNHFNLLQSPFIHNHAAYTISDIPELNSDYFWHAFTSAYCRLNEEKALDILKQCHNVPIHAVQKSFKNVKKSYIQVCKEINIDHHSSFEEAKKFYFEGVVNLDACTEELLCGFLRSRSVVGQLNRRKSKRTTEEECRKKIIKYLQTVVLPYTTHIESCNNVRDVDVYVIFNDECVQLMDFNKNSFVFAFCDIDIKLGEPIHELTIIIDKAAACDELYDDIPDNTLPLKIYRIDNETDIYNKRKWFNSIIIKNEIPIAKVMTFVEIVKLFKIIDNIGNLCICGLIGNHINLLAVQISKLETFGHIYIHSNEELFIKFREKFMSNVQPIPIKNQENV